MPIGKKEGLKSHGLGAKMGHMYSSLTLFLSSLSSSSLSIINTVEHSSFSHEQAVGELINQKLRPLEACSVPGISQERLVSPACMQGLNQILRDFPGVPVVKNPLSNARDAVSIPGQGTKIPHATGPLSSHAPQLLSPLRSRACALRLEKPQVP